MVLVPLGLVPQLGTAHWAFMGTGDDVGDVVDVRGDPVEEGGAEDGVGKGKGRWGGGVAHLELAKAGSEKDRNIFPIWIDRDF